MAATLQQTRAAARRELVAAGFLPRDVDACLALTRPALFYALAEGVSDAAIPLGASKIGGRPDLADGTPWPEGASFLVQINLAELPDGVLDIALPREGLLSCFVNRASEALLIWNKPGTTLMRLPLPDSSLRCEARALAATFLLTLDIDDPALPAVDDDEIFDVIDDWSVPENGVQLGGNRKIIGRREARDMRLVLQIGTFEDIGLVWGELGRLTVSMRPDDIAARRFDRVHSEVQSY